MAGGIGASWHAIRWEAKSDPKFKWNLRENAPQGSALLGNPPLAATAAWQDIERHAAWLGLDWLRVEIDRRMFEPERGRYDWQNDETQTLHRIMDWCQRHDADVFLTQMWVGVDWLSIPGVHPVRSAPNNAAGYAEGFAALVEHLQRERKYSCLKWLCLTNEPNLGGLWWEQAGTKVSLAEMAATVRKELDRRGLTLPISGPDWTGFPKETASAEALLPSIGAVDFHDYNGARRDPLQQMWVQWAHQNNKPFFLSEFGDMSLGWQKYHPGPSTYEAALSCAQKVLYGMSLGVDAFNRWSFLNRGDIDGQWQLVRTWDLKNKCYYDRVVPEPAAYYGYAMLTRFTAKHSRILDLTLTTSEGAGKVPRVEVAALRSPKGQTTCIILNRESSARAIDCRWEGLTQAIPLHRYQLTEAKLKDPAFRMEADGQATLSPDQSRLEVTVPGRSITVYTSYDLGPEDPGVISEDAAAH